ncbi:hypothetical protein [Dongia sp.]|uniref:hypothetical protein n=1 Tax=Dongia sp. TaxID=1977262 RepID=UPI0035B0CA86
MLSDQNRKRASASTVRALAGEQSQRPDNAPSYAHYLRIKQGVGAEALKAAGLPAAEGLSYDAYAAALRAAKTGARGQPPMQALGSDTLPSQALSGQALSGPAKRALRAGAPIAWCVGLSVAFVGGMAINEIMRDRDLSGGPDLAPVATAMTEAASPVAASPAPILLLQPRIAPADHLPRPSPVASLPVASPSPESLSLNAGPAASAKAALEPLVAVAAQPVTLLPKPKPMAKAAQPAPSPAVKAQKTSASSQSQAPAFWDQLTDLLARNKTSEATAKQRWRNKSEDR